MAIKKQHLGFVVAGLLLGILISAMDNTIVATAMGTIVSDLGGFDQFVWVTSAYMVASMAGMPIFGKLSDMYGRKKFFIFGIVIFLAGSALCGVAHSIVQLSIYRAIQGIGGGALMPIAFTIVFDIFPMEKRGKMSGLFGAVFGTSNLFGPLLGAYITDHFGWHWVFYINLPLGLVSLLLITLYYHESKQHIKQRIDYLGAFTLVVSVVSLMFALELGGKTYDWNSWVIIILFVLFAVFFTLFFFVENRAAEPILSFDMFRKRLFAASTVAGLFYGAAYIAAAIYIPIYVQGVTGGSATNSGLILLPMTLASVAASQTGGILSTRTSYRNIMIGSAVIFVAGVALLGTLDPDTPKSVLTTYMLITGFGAGFSFSILSMSSIHHFDARQRGQATSTSSFMRSFGMTLGITIFGIIQRNVFSDKLKEAFAGMKGGGQWKGNMNPQDILSEKMRASIPKPVLDKITAALSESISTTFRWAILSAVLSLVFVLLMSNERVRLAPKGKPAAVKQGNN